MGEKWEAWTPEWAGQAGINRGKEVSLQFGLKCFQRVSAFDVCWKWIPELSGKVLARDLLPVLVLRARRRRGTELEADDLRELKEVIMWRRSDGTPAGCGSPSECTVGFWTQSKTGPGATGGATGGSERWRWEEEAVVGGSDDGRERYDGSYSPWIQKDSCGCRHYTFYWLLPNSSISACNMLFCFIFIIL